MAGLRVLAIFCNPKGTDPLRLQAEQRVLQQALRKFSKSTVLEWFRPPRSTTCDQL